MIVDNCYGTKGRARKNQARGSFARVLRSSFVLLPLLAGPAEAAEVVTYYYTSPQGSVLAKTDAAGNLINTADYRPYGRKVLGSPESGPGYAGHINDSESGFVYMQARYYDTEVGRFVSVDPAPVNPPSLNGFNRYSYANLNPISNVDPDGRRATVIDGRIFIQPENPRIPAVVLPNTVQASGFGTGIMFHSYMTDVATPLSIVQAGEGLKNNPTPGDDVPASPSGSINNVGALPPLAANNFVGSFLVASPNPSLISDITVNYTLKGAHALDEGFVMRYGEKQQDGGVVIRNYGEGNSPVQSGFTGVLPLMMEETVWRSNVKEIVDDAN